MKLKVKVKKIFEKSCNGRNGTFIRRAILDSNTEEWFSASADQWNFKPVEGEEYEIEYQKNGTYNNLTFPRAGGGDGGGGVSAEQLKTITDKLDKIIELVTPKVMHEPSFPEEDCEIKGSGPGPDDVPY